MGNAVETDVGPFEVSKEKETNMWGQRYTKSWSVIDTRTGAVVASGTRDNLGNASRIMNEENRKFTQAKSEGVDYRNGLFFNESGNPSPTLEGALSATADETASDTRKEEYGVSLQEYKDLIKDSGDELADLAQTKEARQSGQMLRMMEQTLLAKGEDPAKIQAILARGTGASGRNLQDVLTGVQAQTKQQLAGAQQFDIGTQLNLDELDIKHDTLRDAMTTFIMGQETERAETQAAIDAQPEWWENSIGGIAQGAGTYYGMKASATIASGGTMAWTCFDGSTQVITPDGFVPFELLSAGDMISTTDGYKPVNKVYKYETPSTIKVNKHKVTEHHPYIMEDGSLELSGNLKEGDRLWGKNVVKSVKKSVGSGSVYNIDIDGHTFHLDDTTLVHTGRRK